MHCPQGHGEMELIKDGALKKKYVCRSNGCNIQLELNTETGKVVQVATGVAAIGAAVAVVAGILTS